MKIMIPNYVNTLLKRLEENGFEAFIVGGSVRDTLLGTKPSDYDITTDALPEKIEEIFKDFRTVEIGKEFGTIVVVQDEGNVEITTYRIEKKYINGRRPSKVWFSKNIVEDLKRRDFTINAIAYSESKGLVDPFDGRLDLRNKIIKTVGDPKERFSEDHLRILRCIRFSATLNFQIENDTLKATKQMGHLLEKISTERIRDELFKILLSEKPSIGVRLLNKLDILKIIIPELTGPLEHTLCLLDNTAPILEVRLAALFNDLAKPVNSNLNENNLSNIYSYQDKSASIAKNILKRFNTSKKIINTVATIIKNFITLYNEHNTKELKKLISKVGKERIFYLLDLQIANIRCTGNNKNIIFLKSRQEEIKKIIDRNEPIEKKQLAINGKDIVKLGYVEGEIIGEILEYLLELVLEEPKLNKKEILTGIVLREFKMK